jgi:hypothetical protein
MTPEEAKKISERWPKKKDKILKAEFDGNLYYPFDEQKVWFLPYNDDAAEWKIIPYPPEILYNPLNGTLIELILDPDPLCLCSSRDLFNFGCRC